MRALIDTCIFVDFATGRDEELLNMANQILADSYLHRFEGFVTSKAVTDIYYLLHHFSHDKKETTEYISRLLDYVSVLDVNESDCIKALRSQVPDYEDAVMVECAKRHNIDCIITDNLKDFRQSEIPAKSSKEFFLSCKGKQNLPRKEF